MSYEPKQITEIWAWVCTEPDGGEGIPAINRGDQIWPLLGADKERVESMRPHALMVAQVNKLPVKLLKFTNMEVVEVLDVQSS